ncbi:MAG TPA: hypothetical protein PLY73_15640, partial [Candidatus Ozemobacteraceae bacterium]|nr:hypothetical protein [Candidatus Ozemobacteraceae bacterium]
MVETLIQTLSKRRFETYLRAAGHDQERAFELYLWNAELGASFHILVQAVEVALRNRVNAVLVMQFGADWWQEDMFFHVTDHDRDRDLKTVMTRLHNKRKTIETDQIVASLS